MTLNYSLQLVAVALIVVALIFREYPFSVYFISVVVCGVVGIFAFRMDINDFVKPVSFIIYFKKVN